MTKTLERKGVYDRQYSRDNRATLRIYQRTRYQRVQEMLAGRPKPSFCELCNLSGRICFDHDHETGKFRGWICHRCNVVLGLAVDNETLLKKMAIYLQQKKNVA